MTGAVSALGTVASVASAATPYTAAIGAVANAGLSYAASQRQKNTLKDQAKQADFQATQEELRGRAQVAAIDQNLRTTLASQRARYAAAGVDLDGTPGVIASETNTEATRQATIARTNATMTAEARRLNGRLLLDQAETVNSTSYINAGLSLFDGMDRALARVPGTVTAGVKTRAGTAAQTPAQQSDYALGPLY